MLLIQKLRVDGEKNYVLTPPALRAPNASNSPYSNEADLIRTALELRSDRAAADLSAVAANHDVAATRGAYFPRLDLQFSLLGGARHYDQLIINGVDSLPANQPSISSQLGNQIYYVVGLNLTWEIFSRGVTREAVAQSRVTADNLEIDAVDRHKRVVAEVRQALGDYRSSLQQLDSTQSGMVAAQKAYDVVEGRYEVGASSFIDLITSQAALVQAAEARAQALIGYELQIRSIETALGRTE